MTGIGGFIVFKDAWMDGLLSRWFRQWVQTAASLLSNLLALIPSKQPLSHSLNSLFYIPWNSLLHALKTLSSNHLKQKLLTLWKCRLIFVRTAAYDPFKTPTNLLLNGILKGSKKSLIRSLQTTASYASKRRLILSKQQPLTLQNASSSPPKPAPFITESALPSSPESPSLSFLFIFNNINLLFPLLH